MAGIYKVKYYKTWSFGDTVDEEDSVIAKNAEAAIEKVKKHTLKEYFIDEDEAGKKTKKEVVTNFELISVNCMAEADY